MAINANKKVVTFQLKVEALGDDLKSLDDIKKRVKELNDERSKLNLNTEQGRKEFEKIGKELANLKGVQQQERQELRQQVKSFQLLGKEAVTVNGSIRDLQEENKRLGEQLRTNVKGVSITADEYEDLEKRFKENAVAIADFNRNLSASSQLVGEYDRGILNALKNFGGFDQLTESLQGLNKKQADLIDKGNELRRQYAKLEKDGGEAFEEVKRELISVDKELSDVNGSIKQVESSLQDATKEAKGIKGAIKGIGGLLIAEFTLDKVIQFAEHINEVQQELNKLNADLSRTFNITETAAGRLSIQIQAISDSVENVDVDGLFEAARSGAKAYDEEIGNVVETLKELSLNSSAPGEALDQFREYAPVLREVFDSTEEVAAAILQFERLGIPLDKGVDALKEFNLRITAQSKTTVDAVTNAFGAAFSDELFAKVKKGEISISEALTQISTKLKDTNVDAKAAQAVVSGVFGAAGEDAGGRKFIEQLSTVNFNLKELTSTSTTYTDQKRQEIELNEELLTQTVRINSLFGLQGESITNLGLRIKVDLLSALNNIVEVFSYINSSAIVQNLNKALGSLADGISYLFGDSKRKKDTEDFNNGISALGDKFKKAGNDFRFYEETVVTGNEKIKDSDKKTSDESKKNTDKKIEQIDLLRLKILEFNESVRTEGQGFDLGTVRINAAESLTFIESQIQEIRTKLSTETDGGARMELLLELESTETAAEKIKSKINELAQSITPSELEGIKLGDIEGITLPIDVAHPDDLGAKLAEPFDVGLSSVEKYRQSITNLESDMMQVGEASGLVSNLFGDLAKAAGEGSAAYDAFTRAARIFAAAQQIAAQASIIAGIAKSIAGGPLGFINALKIAASIGAILASVKGAFAKLEDGGSLEFIGNTPLSKGNRGVIGGKRHSQGGEKGFYKGKGIEAEAGEGLAYVAGSPFIFSRKAMALPDVRQFLEAGDYTFSSFETGGSLNVLAAQRATTGNTTIINQSQGITASELERMIDGKISQIQVVNVATDTVSTANKVKKVQNEYSI